MMKHIEISFDDQLLQEIDHLVSTMQMSRSEIIMNAVRDWLKGKEASRIEVHSSKANLADNLFGVLGNGTWEEYEPDLEWKRFDR